MDPTDGGWVSALLSVCCVVFVFSTVAQVGWGILGCWGHVVVGWQHQRLYTRPERLGPI